MKQSCFYNTADGSMLLSLNCHNDPLTGQDAQMCIPIHIRCYNTHVTF